MWEREENRGGGGSGDPGPTPTRSLPHILDPPPTRPPPRILDDRNARKGGGWWGGIHNNVWGVLVGYFVSTVLQLSDVFFRERIGLECVRRKEDWKKRGKGLEWNK